ncbi:OmpH family outer membrane protein [Lacinutrix salivirga]
MKQFKTLLIAAALFIGATSFTQAQNKVAHIDTQALISAMPEMKSAQTQIEQLGKTYEADIKTQITNYQNKMKQYAAEVNNVTDEVNKTRSEEVGTLQQNIQLLQNQAQQDLQKKEIELLKPIQEKAMAAINKVAKAQGIQYVMDRASLIVAEGTDLLPAVKAEMGI